MSRHLPSAAAAVDGSWRILPQKSQQSPSGGCSPLDRGAAAPSGAPKDAAVAPAMLCSPAVWFFRAPAAQFLTGSVLPVPARPSVVGLAAKSQVKCWEGTDL